MKSRLNEVSIISVAGMSRVDDLTIMTRRDRRRLSSSGWLRFAGSVKSLPDRQNQPLGDRSNPHCGMAALFEFLPTAARTWVVSPDAFERILQALAAGAISLRLLSPPLLVLAVLLGKAIPSGQLFDGVTEKRILVIIRTPGFARMLDSRSEILLEMIESKNVAVNEARFPKVERV